MKQYIALLVITIFFTTLNAQENIKQDTIIPLKKGKLSNGVTIKDILTERSQLKDTNTVKANDAKITKFPLYNCSDTLDVKMQFRCLNRFMQKHIRRKYNTDVGGDQIEEGKYRVYCFFTISKTGEPTDIKVFSTYDVLEKEGERVVKLLPKTNPAIIDNKPVAIRYILPIVFSIE